MTPINMTITNISGFFTSIDTISINTVGYIQIQVWTSSTPNNIFTSIGPTLNLLPSLPNNIDPNTFCYGSINVNIPISANTRIIMGIRLITEDMENLYQINETFSGGIIATIP